jgi:hypothetical protein
MLTKKPEKSPDDFWREYEEETGEKVLTRGMGKYISGWDEFDEKRWNGIWGLIITTSGGFRFYHFPQHRWIDTVSSHFAGNEQTQTFFIPQEKITSTNVIRETKWWKRILSSSVPRLVIRYTDEAGWEKQLLFESMSNKD